MTLAPRARSERGLSQQQKQISIHDSGSSGTFGEWPLAKKVFYGYKRRRALLSSSYYDYTTDETFHLQLQPSINLPLQPSIYLPSRHSPCEKHTSRETQYQQVCGQLEVE
ncbi:hypothetical protein AVEN_122879-1 [Araneus ventricosus]|uniref:Uncharacterized protein n=1 Tax=Araneus ventricosus TaxID=182803 RepID=A0A4Y2QR56_ARAVE|nr:hypothetical protein AVEN_122879-1 [Araneus ventricosus]